MRVNVWSVCVNTFLRGQTAIVPRSLRTQWVPSAIPSSFCTFVSLSIKCCMQTATTIVGFDEKWLNSLNVGPYYSILRLVYRWRMLPHSDLFWQQIRNHRNDSFLPIYSEYSSTSTCLRPCLLTRAQGVSCCIYIWSTVAFTSCTYYIIAVYILSRSVYIYLTWWSDITSSLSIIYKRLSFSWLVPRSRVYSTSTSTCTVQVTTLTFRSKNTVLLRYWVTVSLL